MKKGINLAQSLQQNWIDNSVKNILKLCFSLSLLVLIALSFHFYFGSKKNEISLLNQNNNEQKEQLEKIEQSLTNLTPLPINYTKVLKTEEIEKLVNLLQELPVKSAGISVIRFYVDQGLKLKIAGTYQHQQDFEELENFFKENGFSINIEYLQSNDKAKADFSIIIYKE
nr:hypothetical protein [uncultured Haemophilus sp.]